MWWEGLVSRWLNHRVPFLSSFSSQPGCPQVERVGCLRSPHVPASRGLLQAPGVTHRKSWQMGKTVMFLICRICFNLPNTKLVLPLVSGSLLSLIATVPSLCPQPLQLHRRNGAKSRIFHYWIKHLGEKWASINAILLLIMIFQWHIIKLFLFIYF